MVPLTSNAFALQNATSSVQLHLSVRCNRAHLCINLSRSHLSSIEMFLLFIEGVKAKVFIRARPFSFQGRDYLRLQQLKMDFSVQSIKMGVENIRDSNAIIRESIFWGNFLEIMQRICALKKGEKKLEDGQKFNCFEEKT